MIFGIQTELFEDQKGRRILRVKTTGDHYLVPDKKAQLVRFLQTNVINAATISLIVGMFFKWPHVYYIGVAAAVYIGYLLYFNKKILPEFQLLQEKNIRPKQAPRRSAGQLTVQAAAFLLVGGGLVYCVATGQVGDEFPEIAIIAAAALALLIGAGLLLQSFKRA